MVKIDSGLSESLSDLAYHAMKDMIRRDPHAIHALVGKDSSALKAFYDRDPEFTREAIRRALTEKTVFEKLQEMPPGTKLRWNPPKREE